MMNKGKSGNYSNLKHFQQDDEGNILQCPQCKSTHLIKQGNDGRPYSPQRYKCKDCGRKSCNPIVSTEYEIDQQLISSERSVEELIAHREAEFERMERSEQSKDFINIKIRDKKPIGLYVMGDPHIDNPGTDITQMMEHIKIVNETEGLYACNVGDMHDNWARRTKLEGLYAKGTVTSDEAWKLVEWLCKSLNWVFIVGGNHDVWSGDGRRDPLQWMTKPLKVIYQPYSIRICLNLPKHKIRVHCAHSFKGASIYNSAHALVREAIWGFKDHLLLAGHRHISGYMPLVDPNSRVVQHCVQVGSYKKYDDYAKENMFHNKMKSPCAVAVFNTKLDETHPDFIKIFWQVKEGADYLKYLRAEHNGKKK